MRHFCLPCPVCGECYACLAAIGEQCLCEEPITKELDALIVESELRAEYVRALAKGAR